MPQSNWYLASSSPWYDVPYWGQQLTYQNGPSPGTPGYGRMQADEARRNAPDTRANNFSGKMKPETEALFFSLFGDGSMHGGNIGGVDRQFSGGAMNEYQGIGDANFNMGRMMDKGPERVSKWGGTGAMDFYNMDPTFDRSMSKSVNWDQAPELYNMWINALMIP